MKKYLTAVLTISLLLVFFTGCSGDSATSNGELTQAYRIGDGVPEKRFIITTDRLYVYDNDDLDNPKQDEWYPDLGDVEKSKAGLQLIDINFDGYLDIYMPGMMTVLGQHYRCLIWNNHTQNFEYMIILDTIAKLQVNEQDKTLSGYTSEGQEEPTVFEWRNGYLEQIS